MLMVLPFGMALLNNIFDFWLIGFSG